VTQFFRVIEVPSDALTETEDLGTKVKFWFHDTELGLCLFKKIRPETGEDWSEKIAAELCELLNLPHANYELATCNDERGTISPSFIPENGSLFLGNEVLSQVVSGYPQDEDSPSQHTVAQVVDTLNGSSLGLPQNWIPPDGITNAVEVFVGYLLLDAWIGNTDRHHENWGVVRLEGQTYLAPTYDHASSLGRTLKDQERKNRLKTKDKGYSVQAYVEKGTSCLYSEVRDAKPLKIYDAFCHAAKLCPHAANVWLDKLSTISTDKTLALFQMIPGERMSPTAIEFAQQILEINQNRLLEFKSQLQ
jgi:hypothetical protein